MHRNMKISKNEAWKDWKFWKKKTDSQWQTAEDGGAIAPIRENPSSIHAGRQNPQSVGIEAKPKSKEKQIASRIRIFLFSLGFFFLSAICRGPTWRKARAWGGALFVGPDLGRSFHSGCSNPWHSTALFGLGSFLGRRRCKFLQLEYWEKKLRLKL